MQYRQFLVNHQIQQKKMLLNNLKNEKISKNLNDHVRTVKQPLQQDQKRLKNGKISENFDFMIIFQRMIY